MILLSVQLYTQEFYETVIKAKLNPGGVFVTQSGPAGVLSSSEVSCISLTNKPSRLWTRVSRFDVAASCTCNKTLCPH